MSKGIASILSLDPGRTTGIAIAIVQDDKPFVAYYQQELDHKGFWQLLDNTARACDGALNIICERFVFIRSKTGIDLYPCELIGVLHYFVQSYPMNYLAMQNASVQGSKAYFSDKRLKEMGLYQKEFEHGRSAVKHLLHWLQFEHGASFGADMNKCELVTMDWARRNLI